MDSKTKYSIVGRVSLLIVFVTLTLLTPFRSSKTTPWTRLAVFLARISPQMKISMAAIAGDLDFEYYSREDFPSKAKSNRIAAGYVLTVLSVALIRYRYALSALALSAADSSLSFLIRKLVVFWRQVMMPVAAPLISLIKFITAKVEGAWKVIEHKYQIPRPRKKPLH